MAGGSPRKTGGTLATSLKASLAYQKIVSGLGLAIEGYEDLSSTPDFINYDGRAQMIEALDSIRRAQSEWARMIGKNRNMLDDYERLIDSLRSDRGQ